MSTASTAARPRSSLVTRIPTDDSLPRWRAWVATHPVGSSLLAGAVATQFATVFGIWFRGFGLPTLNWPVVNGQLIIPNASSGVQYFAGELSHFADGVFFALLFALLFHPLVPLRKDRSSHRRWTHSTLGPSTGRATSLGRRCNPRPRAGGRK